MRLITSAIAGSVALAVVAPAALARPTPAWSTPTTLSPTGLWADQPAVAVDSSNRVALIWASCTPGEGTCQTGTGKVFARSSSSSSGFGSRKTVASQNAEVVGLRIASGRAQGSWQAGNGSWRASSAPMGGKWTSPTTTKVPGGGGAAIAYASSGKAVSAWIGTKTKAGAVSGSIGLWVSYRNGANASWGTPKKLSSSALGVVPLIDSSGRASVVTTIQSSDATDASGRVAIYDRNSSNGWKRTNVSSTTTALAPVAAMNANGRVAFAYLVCASGFDMGNCTGDTSLQARVRTAPGKALSATKTLAPSALDQVATVDPKGRATIAWSDAAGVTAAQSTSGSSWATTPLEQATILDGPLLAVNSKSQLVAAWVTGQLGGGSQTARAVARDASGSFGDAVGVSATTEFVTDLALAVGDGGKAVLAWTSATESGAQTIPLQAATARVG